LSLRGAFSIGLFNKDHTIRRRRRRRKRRRRRRRRRNGCDEHPAVNILLGSRVWCTPHLLLASGAPICCLLPAACSPPICCLLPALLSVMAHNRKLQSST